MKFTGAKRLQIAMMGLTLEISIITILFVIITILFVMIYNYICNLSVKPIIRLQIELKYNCNDYKSNCNTGAKRLQIAMMGLTLKL